MRRLHERVAALTSVGVLTFDLDDTLWDVRATIGRAEQVLHEWLDEHFPQVSQAFGPADIRRLCVEVARARPDWAHDRGLVRRQAIGLAAQRAGMRAFPLDEAYAVFDEARHRVAYFADAVPVLEALSRRFVLGAVSNGSADVRRLEISGCFDFAVNAAQAGVQKPDPRIFRMACSLARVRPQRVAHVGDHAEEDALGALGAGLHAIWLNRGSDPWPASAVVPACRQVVGLGELLHLFQP